MSSSAAARAASLGEVRLGRLPEQLLGLVAHLLDDPAQPRVELVPVDPPGRLADVHGEVGRPLDLGDDPQRGDDLAQVAGHRRLQGEHPVAALLELERPGVDLVVGEDHVLGTLEVLAEQDLGGPRDVSVTPADSLAISSRISSSSLWNSGRRSLWISVRHDDARRRPSAEPSRDVLLGPLVVGVGEDLASSGRTRPAGRCAGRSRG